MWSHIHDDIDFASLAGARIGVLGGGTGAFDNAATALEHGAASVTVHMRRPSMPTVNPYRWMEFPGVIENYWSFTDDQKWALNQHLSAIDQPATQGAVSRAFSFAGFRLEYASPWLSVEPREGAITVATPNGRVEYDHVFAATGVAVDLSRRGELAEYLDEIALWRDRYSPDGKPRYEGQLDYPYLADSFAFTHRDPSVTDSPITRLYAFNHSARMSLGVLSHQVSGLVGGTQRLVEALARDIFAERSERLLQEFLGYHVDAGVVVGPAAAVDPSGPPQSTGERSRA
jgi:cation diffusion facilitator CzcD-associated flavoprotein CzcO